MRWLLAVAALAVAGVAALLLYADPDPKRAKGHHGTVDGDGTSPDDPNGNGPAKPDPLPNPQESPEKFLQECVKRGESAVPELIARLESGRDAQLQPRWLFRDGVLLGHPTLRSIYLDALRQINPEALLNVLAATESVQETYFIALALKERGGWTEQVLKRAAQKARPRLQGMQADMVELAATTDPGATAAYLLRSAPRGEDKTIPRALATGLKHLPGKQANATAEALITADSVTLAAKVTYMRAFCDRTDVGALRTLTAIIGSRQLSERLATEAAYLAVDAGGFVTDGIDFRQAIARGDQAGAQKIRLRFEQRLEEVRRLGYAVFGFDINTSDDPKARPLRDILNRQKKRLP